MLFLSYKAIYHLVDTYYVRRSVAGVIDHYSEHQQKAIETAHVIEDYSFLQVLVNDRNNYEEQYAIFMNPKVHLVTMLEKDKDLSIPEFAKLLFDLDIDLQLGLDLIESVCTSNGLGPEIIEEHQKHLDSAFKVFLN